jgi:hypothetical protein
MLDDGELDDIQELLDDIGVAYARIRGGAIVDGTPPPTDLLISTPRRIEAVNQVDGGQDIGNPLRLVVVNEDSNALREQLRRSGFDYLAASHGSRSGSTSPIAPGCARAEPFWRTSRSEAAD